MLSKKRFLENQFHDFYLFVNKEVLTALAFPPTCIALKVKTKTKQSKTNTKLELTEAEAIPS